MFRNLPTAVLGAIVIAAPSAIVEIRGVARLAHVSPRKLVVRLIAFAGVAVFGVIVGVGIAVAVALLASSIERGNRTRPSSSRRRCEGGYHDVDAIPKVAASQASRCLVSTPHCSSTTPMPSSVRCSRSPIAPASIGS